MTTVLVTGATGYLGSAAARSLRASGHRVVGTARTPAAAEKLAAAGVHPVAATLEQPTSLVAALSTVDAVVHAAFGSGDGAAAAETAGVRAMLTAIGDRPFLYTSGIGVVGETGECQVGEDAPVRPPAWMGWRRELELATLAAGHGLVLRPALVYGRAGGLVLTGLIRAALQSGAARYVAPGTNEWPNVHVDDVGDLAARALDAAPGTVLHAVAGESTPRRVAEAIGRLIGRPEATTGVPPDRAPGMVPFADWLGTRQRVAAPHAHRLGWTPAGRPLEWEVERGSYRYLLAEPR
ncbi:MAG TPA: NAD-dependent epimerase/dehydratase family protein [Actinophytocola sp.]|jgi:nucleoside-diphosphate-sugar epimerase|uniref:NAD-dependent epimerase/dehydratase family protein n=1 Tax=Actinophytocola sp. TaxID=1872138 RepID=UPI002F946055